MKVDVFLFKSPVLTARIDQWQPAGQGHSAGLGDRCYLCIGGGQYAEQNYLLLCRG